jgi:hypothetical protein
MAPRDVSTRVRAGILPLAGLGLILYANAKLETLCNCGGEPLWLFYLFAYRPEPNALLTTRALLLLLALGVQIYLCLLIPNNKYVKMAIVLGIVAILIAPDMSLLASNKIQPFSADQWRDALTSRETRVALLNFLALFINLATALYRANAYVLSKI